jgi:hypothetical protein
MSQEDLPNVRWAPAVSCGVGLRMTLEAVHLFETLRLSVSRALRKKFGELSPDDCDELFAAAVARLLGKPELTARFSCLFGRSIKGHPGPLAPYVAQTAKNLRFDALKRRAAAARRQQKLAERQKRLEQRRRARDIDWNALEWLAVFREKLGRLWEATRNRLSRRQWNAIMGPIHRLWPVPLGTPPPLWPDVATAPNPATGRSDRFRARREIAVLVRGAGFNAEELDLLYLLGLIIKPRPEPGRGNDT